MSRPIQLIGRVSTWVYRIGPVTIEHTIYSAGSSAGHHALFFPHGGFIGPIAQDYPIDYAVAGTLLRASVVDGQSNLTMKEADPS